MREWKLADFDYDEKADALLLALANARPSESHAVIRGFLVEAVTAAMAEEGY